MPQNIGALDALQERQNHTRTCWILKCDIRKFFASIDRQILLEILAKYLPDECIQALVVEVVGSFHSQIQEATPLGLQRGLPLGNLTSQLLVNIYMNEFDQFVKHTLKAKCYVRYADDFVILHHDKRVLETLLPQIARFLEEKLHLQLHPHKVSIGTVSAGVDFLGWLHFSDHRVLRTATKRRMLKRIAGTDNENVVASYLGMLKHGNAGRLSARVKPRHTSNRVI